jgi:signal transduction histidine kinase
MSAPSSDFSSPEEQLGATPEPAGPDAAVPSQPAERRGPQLDWERLAAWPRWRWRHWQRWLLAHTFIPRWVPSRWRHPATGYVLAVLLQGVAVALTWLLTVTLPTFSFPSLLEIVVVALVALSWGAGPSLLAALVGIVLLETVVVPLGTGEGPEVLGDVVEVALFVAAGIGISLVASRMEGNRQRAEMEQAEAQARELAMRQVQERMDEFVAVASHDLRTPVTVALAALSFASRRFERLVSAVKSPAPNGAHLTNLIEGVRRSLSTTNQSVDRLARLVVLLFDTAQVRAGALDLQLVECDLAEVVGEPVEALRLAHPQRPIILQVVAEGPLPLVADGDRLERVVTNYLTNALKYSPEDQPVAVRLEVEGEGRARVAVTDHGPGLTPSEQERVWQRFYRAEGVPAQSGVRRGLGLGLHISKTIIEAHDGHVGVESAPGQGSTFWFTLPLATASAQAS